MLHATRTDDSVGRGSLRPYAPSIEAFVWIRDRGMCNSVRVSRMMLDRGERIAIVAAEHERCSGGSSVRVVTECRSVRVVTKCKSVRDSVQSLPASKSVRARRTRLSPSRTCKSVRTDRPTARTIDECKSVRVITDCNSVRVRRGVRFRAHRRRVQIGAPPPASGDGGRCAALDDTAAAIALVRPTARERPPPLARSPARGGVGFALSLPRASATVSPARPYPPCQHPTRPSRRDPRHDHAPAFSSSRPPWPLRRPQRAW